MNRIVCVFPGSVSGGQDWWTNVKFIQTAAQREPEDITDTIAGSPIGIHRGFASKYFLYSLNILKHSSKKSSHFSLIQFIFAFITLNALNALNALTTTSDYVFNDEWTKEGDPSKFRQIVEVLKETRTKKDPNGDEFEYKDYNIFVTGHSLGGALMQLLSFGLAGSPLTKDDFNHWKKEGTLRHIRVSNDGDHVAVQPVIPPSMGYSQTGVNVHLFERKKADVGYRNQRSAYSAIQFSNPLTMHLLPSHFSRLVENGNNDDLLKRSVEDFYEEYGGDFTN